MNERIRELAEQAGYTPLPGFDFANDLQEVFLKKFAELIVRECANFAYNYSYDEKNVEHYRENGWDCLPGDLRSEIKEHFGVEEPKEQSDSDRILSTIRTRGLKNDGR